VGEWGLKEGTEEELIYGKLNGFPKLGRRKGNFKNGGVEGRMF
jgi:hypothetical protein